MLARDAVVIGGGFYGVTIANYLVERRGLTSVTIVEQEQSLMARASLRNQARVHTGYHYPRSFTTAYRSRINAPRFMKDFPGCTVRNFTKLYAIARQNSKVSAQQFVRFCREIGAPAAPAPANMRRLFDAKLIEQVFLVEEFAFDADGLLRRATEVLSRNGIDVRLGWKAESIELSPEGRLSICIRSSNGNDELRSSRVFNCCYSGLNQITGMGPSGTTNLKHEITEMALLEAPAALARLGVTVMDGPFFSFMPYPARHAFSLSHVRYTPHFYWIESPEVRPYDVLRTYEGASRADWMIRDASRYLPAITDCRYIDSIFEIKTILQKSETDDGRPILMERHERLPGCYSVLGGKIDNIYDVLERLDAEAL